MALTKPIIGSLHRIKRSGITPESNRECHFAGDVVLQALLHVGLRLNLDPTVLFPAGDGVLHRRRNVLLKDVIFLQTFSVSPEGSGTDSSGVALRGRASE